MYRELTLSPGRSLNSTEVDVLSPTHQDPPDEDGFAGEVLLRSGRRGRVSRKETGEVGNLHETTGTSSVFVLETDVVWDGVRCVSFHSTYRYLRCRSPTTSTEGEPRGSSRYPGVSGIKVGPEKKGFPTRDYVDT